MPSRHPISLATIVLAATACTFDWNGLDPRLGEGGGRSASTSSGGNATTTTGTGGATATSGSGAGGAGGTGATGSGGASPCGGTCQGDEQCVDDVCVSALELVTDGAFDNGLDAWIDDNNPVNGEDTISTFTDNGGVCENEPSSGPSARILYQDLAIPAVVVDASFSLAFAQDNGQPLDPQDVTVIEKDPYDNSMDGLEQNAFRIDLVDEAGDPFYAAIEVELFTPVMAMGSSSQLVVINDAVPGLLQTLKAHAGATLRLRIAQVESTFPWLVYVDDVSLVVLGKM